METGENPKAETPESWIEFSAVLDELDLSRAEACRRAGISDTTFFKGLRDGTRPSRRTRNRLNRVIQTEREMRAVRAGVERGL